MVNAQASNPVIVITKCTVLCMFPCWATMRLQCCKFAYASITANVSCELIYSAIASLGG